MGVEPLHLREFFDGIHLAHERLLCILNGAAPAQKVEQKQNAEKPGVIKGTPIKGNGRSMGHF